MGYIIPISFRNLPSSSLVVFILLAFGDGPGKPGEIRFVEGHGRLIEPPSRSTMWRYGFTTPPNYNDHELYCGGFTRQWRVNGGKCGVCGDPWDTKQPRANEGGGMFGRGILVRKYQRSQIVKIRVELTANHMGYFEFRVCPNNNLKKVASQLCLDQYILELSDGKGPRYRVSPGNRIFEMQYQLPEDLTCQQCVMQWRYIAGNNWGTCQNGTESVGCGPQEEFRACSDVAITEADGSANDEPNTLVDPEIYIPKTTNDFGTYDDKYNEIDVDSKDTYLQSGIDHDVEVESVVIIVFVSLIVVLLFFAGLYFYYVRGGKQKVETFITEHKRLVPKFGGSSSSSDSSAPNRKTGIRRPSLPTMPHWTPPTMPKMPLKMPHLPKMEGINWPLTNVPLNKLPSFLNGGKTTHVNKIRPTIARPVNNKSCKANGRVPQSAIRITAPISTINSQQQLTIPPQNQRRGQQGAKKPQAPKPPPRVKKQHHEFTSGNTGNGVPNVTRLATVGARGHNGLISAVPSPVTAPSVPILEIGAPTSVTINGVTVTSSSSEDMEYSTNKSNENASTVSTFKEPVQRNSAIKSSVIKTLKPDDKAPKEGRQQIGWFVPAQPAIANEDLPDSMASEIHLPSLPETQVSPPTSPPPLPACPPPEFDDNSNTKNDKYMV